MNRSSSPAPRTGVRVAAPSQAVLIWLVLGALALSPAWSANPPASRLSRDQLRDKIQGGWAGQMIGVAYGAPTEFKSNGRIGEWDLTWNPDRLENAIQQDDLYVEMTFAKVMDDLGLDATLHDYARAFRDSEYPLWHANAAARRALALGLKAPWSGHPRHNLHANDIDFQIEADFIGLMCPGLPRVSNRFCHRIGRIMNHGDGVYGGMFVCGMYAAAFLDSNPRRVVEAGLACIPADSPYALLLRDVLDAYARHPDDWRRTWQTIEDRWNRDDPCPDGALTPFNIDAKLNGAYIALGLLHGGGDFHRTLEISTRCGQDSDCNPSNAAGVLGVMLGYSRIPETYRAHLPRLADAKFSFTDYSFKDIVASTEARALALIRKHGGRVTDQEVVLKPQTPRPPRLQSWSPGIPRQRIPASDPAWTWSGNWTPADGGRSAATSGDAVTLQFEGVAIAILGHLSQAGGRADVYLDGRNAGVADAYLPPRTYDNCLWHRDGLKPGPHTLHLVARADRHPDSTGHQLSVSEAVVYAAP